MTQSFIVTGTDTGLGKTVVSAMYTLGLGMTYYKPIQSGIEDETDREAVQRMTGLGDDRVLADGIRLTQPLSPHRSAELDGVEIDINAVAPKGDNLLVEGAGGLMVPVNRQTLYIDVFADWGLPVVLTSRTGLGTINHTLLSLEALRKRGIQILGVAFIGDDNPDNMKTISEMGGVKVLGRVPMMDNITPGALKTVFQDNFGGTL
ncbi:dethiobiotin synthase [Magnetovibrio sp. PR-2]|uniref:dethiobiotin synthase n=1 Tax=Magnetovibrio sp. PR-2 TaxID=3120356 RepID=UPI002FCE393F